MNIIPYEAIYKQQIIDMILHTQNTEMKVNLTVADQPDLLDIPGAYIAGGGNFWIAVDNGKVIGTLGLIIQDGCYGILKKFFVRSDHRGQKVGLAMYLALLEYAKAKHLKSIILDTPIGAAAAHSFYVRSGFRQITADDLPFRYNHPPRPCHYFMLDL